MTTVHDCDVIKRTIVNNQNASGQYQTITKEIFLNEIRADEPRSSKSFAYCHRCRRDNRIWIYPFSRPDRPHSQSVFSWPFFRLLRCECLYAGKSVGGICHSGSRDRRNGRGISRRNFRTRSAWARRTRGHGRHLLQGGANPASGGRREVTGLGPVDRQRRGGGPRGANHPDRRVSRLDLWSDSSGWTPGNGSRS